MAMLLGEFEQRLDAKNRVTLPARFRPRFAGGVVVTKGWDKCLFVWDPEGWQRFADLQLSRLDPFTREGRQLERFLFGGAKETELDGQGRVMLPAPLMKHAMLDKEIVVVGVRDHLEIWDRERWNGESQVEGVEDVAERFAERQR
jgi:MraZ protein